MTILLTQLFSTKRITEQIILGNIFLDLSFPLTSFQYARNVTTAFLVAFLVFSESLPSVKFCISSSDNLVEWCFSASLGPGGGGGRYLGQFLLGMCRWPL